MQTETQKDERKGSGGFPWFFRKEAVVGPTNLAEEPGSLEEAAFQSLNQKGSLTAWCGNPGRRRLKEAHPF